MELFALYLQFLSEICEGTRPAPAGITVPAQRVRALAASSRSCLASARNQTKIPHRIRHTSVRIRRFIRITSYTLCGAGAVHTAGQASQGEFPHRVR